MRSERLSRDDEYSYCWPRDWLAEDASDDGIRVLGVDFDTHVTRWFRNCPSEGFAASIAERSADIMKKLKDCGVGKRCVIVAVATCTQSFAFTRHFF